MRHERGFSLIEMLITMVVFTIIALPVVNLILNFGEFTETENARIRQQQESRYIFSSFATELKDAGAILTLANTGGFLGAPPLFNGIYPLNSTTFADGVIVATGDPNATTTLAQTYQPSATNTLQVRNLVVSDPDLDPTTPPLPWQAGDTGIVIGVNGYYVFSVTAANIGSRTLVKRATPVYYSGLLNTTTTTGNYTYDDPEVNLGNTATYPINAPVVRLSRFSIYIFDEVPPPATAEGYIKGRNNRRLMRITDTNGVANVLAGGAGVVSAIISEFIWDMQISYITYPQFPAAAVNNTRRFFAGIAPTDATVWDLANLLIDLRNKSLKEIHLSVVALTDNYGGRTWTRQGGMLSLSVPAIKDAAAYTLPPGKYSYKKMDISIDPKNYNIAL